MCVEPGRLEEARRLLAEPEVRVQRFDLGRQHGRREPRTLELRAGSNPRTHRRTAAPERELVIRGSQLREPMKQRVRDSIAAPPRVLEHFVRGEVPSAAQQRHAALECLQFFNGEAGKCVLWKHTYLYRFTRTLHVCAKTTHMGDFPPQTEARAVKKGDHYHHPDLREAMIRVAQELLESEGPSSWTVRAAARIAGVSSGAPYRHFADKDTLLAAVAARGFDELRAELTARLELSAEDPLARFEALGETYVRFALARPGRYQIMFGRDILNRQLHPELCAAADRAFASLLAEVERAQQAGLLRTDQNAPALAAGAWAVVHGLADLLLSGRLNEIADDPMELTAQLGRIMFEGLLARERPVT